MALSISLSLTFLIKLPISNAIDDAPNGLHVVYQASVAFFAALIAFQVLFRETSSNFDVFIKAIDANPPENKQSQEEPQPVTGDETTQDEDETTPLLDVTARLSEEKTQETKDWISLSEKEKEFYLAKCVMSALAKYASYDKLNVLDTNENPLPKNTNGYQTCFSQLCGCRKDESRSDA